MYCLLNIIAKVAKVQTWEYSWTSLANIDINDDCNADSNKGVHPLDGEHDHKTCYALKYYKAVSLVHIWFGIVSKFQLIIQSTAYHIDLSRLHGQVTSI